MSDSFATLFAITQTPLSKGLSQQENWSGLPFPSPGDPPGPGIKPPLLHWQANSLPEPPGKPKPEKLGTGKVTQPILLNKQLISSISTFQKGHVEYNN